MFKLNLKIALRNLWKNKGFTAINIGGLAVGLTSCLLLLLYVNYEFSYNKQLEDVERVYETKLNLEFNGTLATTRATPNKLAAAAIEEIPGIELAARIADEGGQNLYSHNENKFKLEVKYVDPDLLNILKYKIVSGTRETALATPNSIVLTASVAEKLFGNENPIGRSLKWDNKKELQVSAVIEDLPKNQTIQFDVLQPWSFFDQLYPLDKENSWGNISCTTLFKLKEQVDPAAVNALLKNFIVDRKPDLKPYVAEPFLFPFGDTYLYDKFENGKAVGGKIDEVRLFGFLALCVLFIACINYMNLSTARSEKRAREVGVRKALGAVRGTLIGQFMLESLLLSMVAMLIAFTLLETTLPYFNNLLDVNIVLDYSSPFFWLTLFALVLLTGVLAGSYPSFYLSSFIPVKVLKGFKTSGSSLSVRRVLVVVQFSLSVCMIISAIFIYNQMNFLKNKPTGFNDQNLVQLEIEGTLKTPSTLNLFKNELQSKGFAVATSEYVTSFTRGGSITGDLSWPGKSQDDKSIVNYRGIGFDFVKTIDAHLVSGRDLSREFPADTSNSILLNEAAVKLMGLKDPLGTIVHWGTEPLTVVGVIKDYSSEQIGYNIQPTFYYQDSKNSSVLLMRLSPNHALATSLEGIKTIGKELNPAYPVEVKFISEGMQEKLKSERLLSTLSNFFGGFAILISCLGLLGLALYMAEQRNKEISIRKVLGANLGDILVLLNKDFLKLVLFANVIAIPIAYILIQNWLKKYDYRIEMGYMPFLLAIIASILIAIVTVSFQTFKVVKANAVNALKYE